MTKTPMQTALEMSQPMLERRRNNGDGPLKLEEIEEAVDKVLGILDLSDDTSVRREVVRELEARYSVWIGDAVILESNDGHEAWLTPERRADWRLWARYRQYLEQRWSVVAVDALDKATNDILGRIEDPKRTGAWDRRGMVVGHVQSGKTSSYTGLICKAVDAGYKVIIVLAGLHNNLRSQTQMRLDEGFLGYDTRELGKGGDKAPNRIGVGKIDPLGDVKLDWVTTAEDKGDFTMGRVKNLGIHPGGHPMLFVVKKNGSVLKNLLKWIDRTLHDEAAHENVPLLIIDDEADHASVDTKDQARNQDGSFDQDHNPTVINQRIRKLLRKFHKSAYVGYTATPFANIYIHERGETASEGPDLFPRSFIINLPAPSNYDGPVRIFGLEDTEDQDGVEPLPLVRVVDGVPGPDALDWLPQGHKNGHRPQYEGEDALPPTIEEALRAFILVCATRRARGQEKVHNSMLVHVTRFTNVQAAVRGQIDVMMATVRDRIKYNSGGQGSELAAFRDLWEADFVQTSAEMGRLLPDRKFDTDDWESVRAEILPAIERIQVRTINGTAGDILDYDEHEQIGFNVIAIGGDKLARGLTLEGLSVSYFLRATKMYDTLMQMGRWFGYRPGYLDLCRLYMTQDLHDWFRHITEASEELRREFDHMRLLNGTPRDYGLRVKSHSVMMVTSRVKMRNGTQIEIDFAGALRETVLLHRDKRILHENLLASEQLISQMGTPSEEAPRRGRSGRDHVWSGVSYWSDVPAALIVEFLVGYKTHDKALKVHSALIANYIEQSSLSNWHVALMAGDNADRTADIAGRSALLVHRKPRGRSERDGKQHERGEYIIRRLLSPRDEAIDLGENEYAEALQDTQRAWVRDSARSGSMKRPDTPNGPAIRAVRGKYHPERGLLLLYPLDPKIGRLDLDIPDIEFDDPIVGFGISFPSMHGRGTTVKYTVNNVYWQQEMENA